MTLEIEGGEGEVTVRGALIDEVDLAPLLAAARPRAVVDLEGVTRINSAGIRCWVQFAHEIPADVHVSLARCPTFFFKQITMIRNFLGRTRLVSLFLPMVCDACDEESEQLVEIEGLSEAPTGTCASCGGPLELDEADEVFASFLAELKR